MYIIAHTTPNVQTPSIMYKVTNTYLNRTPTLYFTIYPKEALATTQTLEIRLETLI